MLQTVNLTRGDVVWLKLPQSLSNAQAAQERADKTRPFIVLNQSLTLRTDHNGVCLQDRSIFGMDCTSKNYLVEGRPTISFELPGQDMDSYAFVDCVRDVSSYDQKIRVRHHLPEDDEKTLIDCLDKTLQPEQKFFLSRLFNAQVGPMPGQIWDIETVSARGEALVLLKRGQFVCSHNVERSEDIDPRTQEARYTPYLVAHFKRAKDVKTLRGIKWDDIEIMAVHEQAFMEKKATLTTETSGILLNSIRARAGLTPIEYKQPIFRDMINPLALLRMLAGPMPAR